MTLVGVCEVQLFGVRKADERRFSASACEFSFMNICDGHDCYLCFMLFHINS